MVPESISDQILSCYLAHRPKACRPTLKMWRLTVQQMLADGLTHKEAHEWIVKHQGNFNKPVPDFTSLRDWMGKLGKENGELKKKGFPEHPTDFSDASGGRTAAKRLKMKTNEITKEEQHRTAPKAISRDKAVPEKPTISKKKQSDEVNGILLSGLLLEELNALSVNESYPSKAWSLKEEIFNLSQDGSKASFSTKIEWRSDIKKEMDNAGIEWDEKSLGPV